MVKDGSDIDFQNLAALLGPTLIASGAMVIADLDAMPGLDRRHGAKPDAGRAGRLCRLRARPRMVYSHNRWAGGWPVLVTVMGSLSLVVGLIRMIFPMQIAAMASKLARRPAARSSRSGWIFC